MIEKMYSDNKPLFIYKRKNEKDFYGTCEPVAQYYGDEKISDYLHKTLNNLIGELAIKTGEVIELNGIYTIPLKYEKVYFEDNLELMKRVEDVKNRIFKRFPWVTEVKVSFLSNCHEDKLYMDVQTNDSKELRADFVSAYKDWEMFCSIHDTNIVDFSQRLFNEYKFEKVNND